MNYNSDLRCKNCRAELNYALIPDLNYECFICKHNLLGFYGVWHCSNECGLDVCPLCSLGTNFFCKECNGRIFFFKANIFQNSKTFQCNLCLDNFLVEEGGHFCYSCKKFFCCIGCRSKQNDLYNRDSAFYKGDFF